MEIIASSSSSVATGTQPSPESAETGFVLVNDNTDNPNFGCRATSISLARILGSRGVLLGTVKKRVADHAVSLVGESSLWKRAARRLLRSSSGPKQDWITPDLRRNVELLLLHRRHVREFNELLTYIESSHCVVINGEGSGIFRPDPRRDLLFQLTIIELCKELGKPVSYVNAMISPAPDGSWNEQTAETFFRAAANCESVILRDPESYSLAKQHALVPETLHFVPDALFGWHRFYEPLDPSGKFMTWACSFGHEIELRNPIQLPDCYVAVTGSSLGVEDKQASYDSYARLISRLQSANQEVVLIPGCARDESFLKRLARDFKSTYVSLKTPVFALGSVLAGAHAFVSGRYHPAIFASFGGVPTVFLRSNSHKTLSLQGLLEYENPREFHQHPDPIQCDEIVDQVLCEEFTGTTNRARISQCAVQLCQKAWEMPDHIPSLANSKVA